MVDKYINDTSSGAYIGFSCLTLHKTWDDKPKTKASCGQHVMQELSYKINC